MQVVIDDARYFHVLDKPMVLEGHLPVGPDDAIINRAAQRTLGLKVGDRLKVMWFSAPDQNTAPPDPATAVPGEMTVSAVIQTFDDALKDPNDPTLEPVIGYGRSAVQPQLREPYELREFWLKGGHADEAAFVGRIRLNEEGRHRRG